MSRKASIGFHVRANALQTKLAASSMLPLPLYLATCGYGHKGRVRYVIAENAITCRDALLELAKEFGCGK